jgi:hypothetical protein
MPDLHSLRTDLEFSNQSQQGKSFVVVKDPVTEKYFRFTETQGVILDAIRSPIDIGSLGSTVAQRLGGTVKRESLEAFLKSLEKKCYSTRPESGFSSTN